MKIGVWTLLLVNMLHWWVSYTMAMQNSLYFHDILECVLSLAVQFWHVCNAINDGNEWVLQKQSLYSYTRLCCLHWNENTMYVSNEKHYVSSNSISAWLCNNKSQIASRHFWLCHLSVQVSIKSIGIICTK